LKPYRSYFFDLTEEDLLTPSSSRIEVAASAADILRFGFGESRDKPSLRILTEGPSLEFFDLTEEDLLTPSSSRSENFFGFLDSILNQFIIVLIVSHE